MQTMPSTGPGPSACSISVWIHCGTHTESLPSIILIKRLISKQKHGNSKGREKYLFKFVMSHLLTVEFRHRWKMAGDNLLRIFGSKWDDRKIKDGSKYG